MLSKKTFLRNILSFGNNGSLNGQDFVLVWRERAFKPYFVLRDNILSLFTLKILETYSTSCRLWEFGEILLHIRCHRPAEQYFSKLNAYFDCQTMVPSNILTWITNWPCFLSPSYDYLLLQYESCQFAVFTKILITSSHCSFHTH
jgi:hypothetical protein